MRPMSGALCRVRRTLLGAGALAWLVPISAARAAMPGPDFSAVTTKTAARKLVQTGELVRIYLFPLELGGPKDPQNIVYVPPFTAEARELLLGTLVRLLQDGTIDQMEVKPDYRGTSIIPTAITMRAWHSVKKGSFGGTIQIW